MKIRVKFSPAFFLFWAGIAAIEPNLWTLCIALAMLWHELGHAAAILVCGRQIKQICFRAAGVEMICPSRLGSYFGDAAVALAGPLFSLIGAAALFSSGYWRFFGAASLLLGLVNALPIRGLDGGAALSALLGRFLLPHAAEAVIRRISIVFSVILWMGAVWIMLVTGGNFSLFVLSVMLFASSALGV